MPGSALDRRLARALTRQRLLDRLDGIYDSRLALVVAPAGCGKTTLMAQWAATTGAPVAWCRADPADAQARRLLERVTGCVLRAMETARGVPAGPDLQVESFDDLVRLMEGFASPMVLVVDDLHALADTTAEAELERFLLLAPSGVVLLIGSRRMPSFNLARSELSDPITIAGDDLRFRSWEVERLFRDIYASPLRPDDAAALTRHTEGWAAALQLFHASTTGRPPSDLRRAVSALATRSRFAQHYLSGQVLAELPTELSDFLLRTSVFETASARRCNELLGRNDSQAMLVDLERRQALITSDDDGRTFHYHEVLRRHLESALHEELGADAARALYLEAASILEANHSIPGAIRARCRAEDWDGVRRLLQLNRDRLTDASSANWLDLLPPWLTDGDAWVALAEARRLLADGRLAAAQRAARRAPSDVSDPTVLEVARVLGRVATTWQPGPLQPSPRWDTALRAATKRHPKRAVDAAGKIDSEFSAVVIAIALLLSGDYRRAEPALRRCSEDLQSNPYPGLIARAVLATLSAVSASAVSARSSQSMTALDGVQVEAARLGFTWLARVAHGVVLATSDGADDGQSCAELIAECQHRGDDWGAAIIASARAAKSLTTGRPDVDLIDDVCQRFRALDAGVLEVWARSLLALASASAGAPEASALARAGESMARLAEVPGALAIGYAALALAKGGRADPTGVELLELAESSARAGGLAWHPWLVVQPDIAVAASDSVAPSARRSSAGRESARIELRLFGGFSITVDGHPANLGSVRPRARTALRLLALNAGTPLHRERLADLLWPELTETRAAHNLQVAISSLRSALQPDVPGRDSKALVRDGDSYLIRLGEGSLSDVRTFDRLLNEARQARLSGQRHAALAALTQAVALYRGDLLPEDGSAEWVTAARDNYRLRAAEASGLVAELQLGFGHAEAAVNAASTSVQIDRWRDASWRILISAHEHAGDVAAANRARRSYAEVLDSLGVGAASPHRAGPGRV